MGPALSGEPSSTASAGMPSGGHFGGVFGSPVPCHSLASELSLRPTPGGFAMPYGPSLGSVCDSGFPSAGPGPGAGGSSASRFSRMPSEPLPPGLGSAGAVRRLDMTPSPFGAARSRVMGAAGDRGSAGAVRGGGGGGGPAPAPAPGAARAVSIPFSRPTAMGLGSTYPGGAVPSGALSRSLDLGPDPSLGAILTEPITPGLYGPGPGYGFGNGSGGYGVLVGQGPEPGRWREAGDVSWHAGLRSRGPYGSGGIQPASFGMYGSPGRSGPYGGMRRYTSGAVSNMHRRRPPGGGYGSGSGVPSQWAGVGGAFSGSAAANAVTAAAALTPSFQRDSLRTLAEKTAAAAAVSAAPEPDPATLSSLGSSLTGSSTGGRLLAPFRVLREVMGGGGGGHQRRHAAGVDGSPLPGQAPAVRGGGGGGGGPLEPPSFSRRAVTPVGLDSDGEEDGGTAGGPAVLAVALGTSAGAAGMPVPPRAGAGGSRLEACSGLGAAFGPGGSAGGGGANGSASDSDGGGSPPHSPRAHPGLSALPRAGSFAEALRIGKASLSTVPESGPSTASAGPSSLTSVPGGATADGAAGPAAGGGAAGGGGACDGGEGDGGGGGGGGDGPVGEGAVDSTAVADAAQCSSAGGSPPWSAAREGGAAAGSPAPAAARGRRLVQELVSGAVRKARSVSGSRHTGVGGEGI
ncbi:hypothetical protein GPECTOR_2g1268 [Gonium pectorale]|uniref:Uncharacterized protein n=1 Tax=Gonium pectorale TaxID=33097 RepID=A0A150H1H4_GONPE|nr:hypothetical protein GPECTOR_2g1268 [Gonium pectorale]|eukprot:KXZ55718.1 hypothetical protein GPECTOR_2g1268 [Gonium pectorale]